MKYTCLEIRNGKQYRSCGIMHRTAHAGKRCATSEPAGFLNPPDYEKQVVEWAKGMPVVARFKTEDVIRSGRGTTSMRGRWVEVR